MLSNILFQKRGPSGGFQPASSAPTRISAKASAVRIPWMPS